MNKSGMQPFSDLIAEIEQDDRFPVGQRSPTALSVTGQPYTELTTITPRLDEGMAFVAGVGIFDAYARNLTGTLYWHTLPQIERARNGKYWGYRVTMKLLISDNPVVPRLEADAQRDYGEDN